MREPKDIDSSSSIIQSKLNEELEKLHVKINSIKETGAELNTKLQKLHENLNNISET